VATPRAPVARVPVAGPVPVVSVALVPVVVPEVPPVDPGPVVGPGVRAASVGLRAGAVVVVVATRTSSSRSI